MKDKVVIKNKESGKEVTLVKKSSEPAPKPVNIRRSANSPEDQVRNGKA